MNLHLTSRCQRNRWCPDFRWPAAPNTASCPSPLGRCRSWWGRLRNTRTTERCHHPRPCHFSRAHSNPSTHILHNTEYFKRGKWSIVIWANTHLPTLPETSWQRSVCVYNMNQLTHYVVEYFPSSILPPIYTQQAELCRTDVAWCLSREIRRGWTSLF